MSYSFESENKHWKVPGNAAKTPTYAKITKNVQTRPKIAPTEPEIVKQMRNHTKICPKIPNYIHKQRKKCKKMQRKDQK